VDRAVRFEARRQLEQIGKPVDKGEWGMTPPTVNAYYNPLMNDMNFPAGVLLPPLYDPKIDAAPNYGNTGTTIGHELTHGFDDQGRKFDPKGRLREWWAPPVAKRFEEKAACVERLYSGFEIEPGVKVNGKLTLGENLADNGGLRVSWDALRPALDGPLIEGFTPAQRFFLAWGQIRCENATPRAARAQVQGDGHSPGRFRVNGVVRNMPELAEAFACPAGAPMAPETRCRLW